MGPASRNGVDQQLHLIGDQADRDGRCRLGRSVARVARLGRNGRTSLLRFGARKARTKCDLAGGACRAPAASDLLDIARNRSTRIGNHLAPGQLDLLAFETVDDIVEAFLRGHDEPQRPTTLLNCFGEALQIEHPVDTAGDILADFVDDEQHRRCSAPRRSEQRKSSLGKPVMGDLGS